MTNSGTKQCEWVIESLIQLLCSIFRHIQESKRVTESQNFDLLLKNTDWFQERNNMSDSLNHSFNQSVQKQWLIQEQNKKWVVVSFIHPICEVVPNCHWIMRFSDLFKNTDLFRNETIWVSYSTDGFQTWTYLGTYNWVIQSTDLFKNTDSEHEVCKSVRLKCAQY